MQSYNLYQVAIKIAIVIAQLQKMSKVGDT